MNSPLNSKFVAALLAAVAAGLVATGVLPREVSDAHIAQASTLLMALIAIWQHGKAAGSASGTNATATDVTNAAIAAAEHAFGEIVTAALGAIEAKATAPAPAPAPAAAPAPAVEAPAATQALPAGTITAAVPAA